MLNVGKIEEGFVLDHIQAGMAMSIYHHLQLSSTAPLRSSKTRAAAKWAKRTF
jgi:aspartate carbamoyltransferase regulatory subunit